MSGFAYFRLVLNKEPYMPTVLLNCDTVACILYGFYMSWILYRLNIVQMGTHSPITQVSNTKEINRMKNGKRNIEGTKPPLFSQIVA